MASSRFVSALSTAASSFWGRYVFTVGDQDFQWLDVAVAAMVHGDWAEFERRLAEGAACEARAGAEHTPPSPDAVEEAAATFRYERDLIAGADLDEWLERQGLSVEDWTAFLTRDLLRRSWADELEDILDQYPPSPKRLHDVAVTDGVCSGMLERFERSFGGRAALAFAETTAAAVTSEPPQAVLGNRAAQLIRQHAHWLAQPDDRATVARVARILNIAAAYRLACERLATADALQAEVSAHRMDWVRVDVDVIELATEAAAREALLCVREDGASLYDVGALARGEVVRRRHFLGDLPEEHRERLLSSDPGRVLGPVPGDVRFEVSVVVTRVAPTLDDSAVAARARTSLEDRAQRRAARAHVRRLPRAADEVRARG